MLKVDLHSGRRSGFKQSDDVKSLKAACKQRGLTHGNRQKRETTISILEEMIQPILQQRLQTSELRSLAT